MSEDDQDVAGALLAELEGGGELVDVGGFSIDTVQARAKLRDFQLADPHEYVLLLIEAAVLAGADPVRVRSDRGELTVSLGSLRIEQVELEQLFAAAFVDLTGVDERERSRRRALQKLAFACNAALRLEPEAIEIEVVGAESVLHLRLRPGDDRGELRSTAAVSERPPSVTVRVARGTSIQGLPEVELVRDRCRFSEMKIELDGERVSVGHRFGLHVELDPSQPALSPNARKVRPIELDGRQIGLAGFRYGIDAPAEVRILTNGVLAELEVLGDEQRVAAANFGAIVELDLPKDLGQSKIARGHEYQRVIEAIWAVHDQLAPAPVPGSGFARPSRASLATPARLPSVWVTSVAVAGIVIGLVMSLSGFGVGFGLVLLFVSFLVAVLHGREPP